jgi:hypothetical protein
MTAVLEAEPAAAATPRAAPRRRGLRRYLPVLTLGGAGVFLAAAFFPRLYDHVTGYDDEGALLATLRHFLDHGSLYDHTHGSYGPFYYSVIGALFRLTGQSPTQFTGRLVVLVFTTLSVIFFGAAVWKVTRSVMIGILCEVATFVVLIPFAGLQPLHPGSLIVLLLAVICYCLASWAMSRHTHSLVVVGVALGGLLMTKINIGLFALAALAIAFVIGNRTTPRWLQILVGVGGVLLPFAVASQEIWQILFAELVVLVSFSVLASYVPLDADGIRIPLRTVVVIVEAMVATIVVSCIWPFLSGSSPKRVFFGVFLQPLGQTDHLVIPVHTDIVWLSIVLTLVGLFAIGARRQGRLWLDRRPAWLVQAALPVAGLLVLGLGLFSGPAAWLPAIVLLPALAWLSGYPRKVRLALRFLVPLAILQMMHVYPVAGSQRAWALVTMCVPCMVAVGAGLMQLPVWRSATSLSRAIAVGALSALLIVTAGQWPLKTWHDYVRSTALNLPGARLIRIDKSDAHILQKLTIIVKKNCDTFYSTPGFDILYFYAQLPEPTGLLANWPGVLNVREQREVAHQLRTLEQRGQRVCIVRNTTTFVNWKHSSYGHGPLGKAVAPFRRSVGHVDRFLVLRYGAAKRGQYFRPGAALKTHARG